MSPAGSQAGFTVLELLVALVLSGLALALVPALLGGSRDRAALDRDSDILRAELTLTRARAIASAAPVDFDPGAGFGLATPVTITPPRIHFRADGSSTGGSLVLTNPTGHTVIRIDPLTGAVSVGRGP